MFRLQRKRKIVPKRYSQQFSPDCCNFIEIKASALEFNDSINIKNMYMHLTNYSLNKNSEKFKLAGEDFADVNSNASKQLLSSVYKKL